MTGAWLVGMVLEAANPPEAGPSNLDMKAYEEQVRLKQTNPGLPAASTSPKSLLPPLYGTDTTSSLKVKIDESGNPNIELKLLN